MFKSILFPKFLRFYMSDESPSVSVSVETPTGDEAEPTVAEQAAQIVETAKDLAVEMSKSEEQIASGLTSIFERLNDLHNSLTELRLENAAGHTAILGRISELEQTAEEIEEEIEEIEEPPSESLSDQSPTGLPPQEIPIEPEALPQKRQRRWL